MSDTIPSPLTIAMSAPEAEEPRRPGIAFRITIAVAALQFLGALVLGVPTVVVFDVASLAAFLLMSFALRG